MDEASSSRVKVLSELFGYVIRWRPSVIATTIVGMLSAAVELLAMASLVPLSQLATQQPISPTSIWHRLPVALGFQPDVKFFAAGFLVLMLLRSSTSAVTTSLINHTYRFLIAHFSASALEGFVRHLTFRDVNKETIGHFMTLGGDEANRAAQMVMSVMRLIPSLVLLFLYVALIFYQAWQFGVGLVSFFVLTVVCLLGAFRRSHRLGHRQQEESRALNTHFIDSLSGLRTVRGFNGEAFVSSRYREMIDGYAWTSFSVDSINLISRMAPALILMLVLLCVCIFMFDGANLAAHLPLIFVGCMMVMRLLPLAGQALEAMLRLTADLRATSNVSGMLRAIRDNELSEKERLPALDAPIRKIVFDRVSFRYGDDTPMVLDEATLAFTAGRSYAITGRSGSGKSSLVDLLLKFYEPLSGAIRVNDTDITAVSSASIRDHIVLVEQTTRVFYSTMLENVRFGREGSRDAVLSALGRVGLSDLLATLPQGVETMINFQGSNFSGGQRQRIGLARGLLNKADVLILDESTNALDATVRESILRNILDAYSDAIVIFVTHDPRVLGVVDEVIHLDALVPARTVAVTA